MLSAGRYPAVSFDHLYYGAWGGWEAGADPLVRRLYVLKQLGTRQMAEPWPTSSTFSVPHETVERRLGAARDAGTAQR